MHPEHVGRRNRLGRWPTVRSLASGAALVLTVGLALCVLVNQAPARACNPVFVPGLLHVPDLLVPAVEGLFTDQIRRLIESAKTDEPGFPFEGKGGRTSSSWYADFSSLSRLPDEQRDARLMGEVRRVRTAISEYYERLSRWQASNWYGNSQPRPNPELDDLSAPERLPADLRLYLDGAIKYHQGDLAQAKVLWQMVLDLPEEERRERSVMAAFMLAQTAKKEWELLNSEVWRARQQGEVDPSMLTRQSALIEHAVKYYRETRRLARAGLHDDLRLAHDSLGWEAHVELRRGGYAEALHLYAEQVMAGNLDALESIEVTCTRLAGHDPDLLPDAYAAVAADPLSREIFTYFLAMQGLGEGAAEWFTALRDAEETPSSAGLVAWTAYQGGQFDAARRWTEIAAEDDPRALWVRGKLAARDGHFDHATVSLDRAWDGLSEIPPEPGLYGTRCQVNQTPARARGDAAAAELERGHYAGALDRFLRSGHWQDAAYVAERVMTVDELESYVEDTWPVVRDLVQPWRIHRCDPPEVKEMAGVMRSLLARRLAREGRWSEAADHYPHRGDAASAQQIQQSLRCAEDPSCPWAQKASGLWQAARVLRDEGMSLVGAELGPDWNYYGGSFDLGPIEARPGAPETEIARVRDSAPTPAKRYHFRYLAADLAWRAASYMPNGSEETASVLWTAGRWLAARDPEAADRFYKALVRRCRNTPLGSEADRLRWFPPADS